MTDDRQEVFQVTCAANVAKASATEVAIGFDPGIVTSVDIHWPAGHASLTGIALAIAHQRLIPNTTGAYLFGNNVDRNFPIRGMPESGQWSAFVYNLDNRPHYWQVVFHVVEIPERRHRGHPESTFHPAHVIHAAADELGVRL